MFCMFSSVLVGHLCRIFCRFLAQFSGPVLGHVVCAIIDCTGFFFFYFIQDFIYIYIYIYTHMREIERKDVRK